MTSALLTPNSTPSTTPPRRIVSLDGLRGLAALVVLAHHALMLLPTYRALEFKTPVRADPLAAVMTFTPLHIVWAGDEAVILFFVLSGLALAIPALRSPRFRWRSYYPSRIARLYVPVIAAAAFASVLYLLSPWLSDAGTFERLTLPTALQVASLTSGSSSFLDGALWSLHWEVLFSLLLPLYVLFARRSGRHWIVWSAVVLAVSTAGWLLHVQLVMFMAVFALGVLLAAHADDLAAAAARISRSRRSGFVWSAIVVCSLCAVTAGWYPLPPEVSRVLGFPLLLAGAVALVLATLHAPGVRRFLGTPAMQWLGMVSFSLYLTHGPVLVAINAALPQSLSHTPAAVAIGIPASVLVGWLFSLTVERPSHRFAQAVGRRFRETHRSEGVREPRLGETPSPKRTR